MKKNLSVTAGQLDIARRRYAQQGLTVETSGPGWVVLTRPPVQKTPPTLWRAVKLTVGTLFIYPFVWLLWALLVGWWLRPLRAARRVDQVTLIVETAQETAQGKGLV